MSTHANFSPLTPEEYLQLEEKAEFKHEYIEGEVYAMAGATDAQVTGIWPFQSYDAEKETFELQSVDYRGSIASLYENATLDAPVIPTEAS
jgi:Uma2 family endonuclease